MSRDATGIYSARAVETSICPVCRAGVGWPCNMDTPGYSEHETHFQRTVDAPHEEIDLARHNAWEVLATVLGREPDSGYLEGGGWDTLDMLKVVLDAFAERVLAQSAKRGERMVQVRDEALARNRKAFDAKYQPSSYSDMTKSMKNEQY